MTQGTCSLFLFSEFLELLHLCVAVIDEDIKRNEVQPDVEALKELAVEAELPNEA